MFRLDVIDDQTDRQTGTALLYKQIAMVLMNSNVAVVRSTDESSGRRTTAV